MAQLERATSRGGKKYLTQSVASKDSVTLPDGTKVIISSGILANLQYKSELKVLGFRQISLEGISIVKDYLEIYCFIPTDFTIDSAFITLNAYKTNNEYLLPETLDTTSIDGKITNIRAYKMTGKTEWTNSSQFGWFVDTSPTGTEITNTFATGGYTNPTTAAITITSIDIKASLEAGMNGIIIQTAEALPNAATDAGTTTAAQQAQLAEAVVTVIGYAK